FPMCVEVVAVCVNCLVKCHDRGHRRVPKRLQFHVPAIFGSLQLDHDEVGISIQCEKVDPAPTILPVSELFGDDHQVGGDHMNTSAQKALQVRPFAQLLIRHSSLIQRNNVVLPNL